VLDDVTITDVPGWTLTDLREVNDLYQTSHSTSGVVPDIFLGSQFEMRVLDILMQRLPAQLAATPLIRPEFAAMAGRVATALSDTDITNWSNVNAGGAPPPVVDYQIGDVNDKLSSKLFPMIVVSGSLPGSNTVTRATIGPTVDQNYQLYVFYLLSFRPSLRRQVEANRGAEAIAAILASYQSDGLTLWQNGQVTNITRNATVTDDGVQANAGIVEFTVFRRTSFTPAFAP
jgi:hypothetical protein